jgi:hypothetical protein
MATLAEELETMAAGEVALAAKLRQLATAGDWIEALTTAFMTGDVIGTAVAGKIMGGYEDGSASTAIRCCIDSKNAKFPIGVQFTVGGAWHISVSRLFIWIEKTEGKPALVKAKRRFDKHLTDKQKFGDLTASNQNDEISDGLASKANIKR